ncbi:MAG: protein kinase [Sandaracinaceae bacterium]
MRVCPRCSELYADDASHCPLDGTPLRAVLDPLIGKTVGGRFRLIQRLGAGGMSSVYLARHVLIDRLMAIKTLRRDLARDPVQRDRFLREARAVNRINHENIVEISDFGETEDGLVYLVMEYVPGEPLLKVMSDGPLSSLRALDLAEQCATALARAHQMGVIHRDLKPENILIVQRRDRRDFVKILDFGIAKIMDAPSLTGSQQIFGTPGYIAPEYIQSTDIDGRADLYSLGCILYELVTGALPFDYEYPGDLLVKHVTEPPVPPSVRHPRVDPPVEAFILRCLEKNPDQRFRDAHHFLVELRAVRERLGPAESWGGLDESHDTLVPPSLPDPSARDTAELIDSLARALDDEEGTATPVEPAPRPRPRRDTLIDELRASGEHEVPSGPLSIPEPPTLTGEVVPSAYDPSASEAPATDEGLLGAGRWRRRYDAIVVHLGQLERPLTPEAEDALSEAGLSLASLEDAVSSASAYQEAVEALHERARDYKATLGRAIDQAAARLSAERGIFESLVTRRNNLRTRREAARIRLRRGAGSEGEADALLWELAAVDEELRGAGLKCDELEAQLGELTRELEQNGERLIREREQLVAVLDAQMLRVEETAGSLRQPLEDLERFVREHWGEDEPAARTTEA